MRLKGIKEIVSYSGAELEARISSTEVLVEVTATLVVTTSEISGLSYHFFLKVDGCEVTDFWGNENLQFKAIEEHPFEIHRYVGEKKYKTIRYYSEALEKKGLFYEDIIRISNEMYERMMLMQELERDAKAEHAASVEEESTVDTVKRENLVKFEVGKFYWASAGHRVIAVKRTAHYVTFNLFKVELEAGQNYFDAEAMTWLKASNVHVKVTKTGNGETCYIKGYEENRAIQINADMPIEIVCDDEEELTVGYNFDVEEEDDDDELIDPPEEIKVEKKETIKFEVGKTYSYMSNDGVSKYASMLKVVKRTKKNIMFIDVDPDFETDEEDVMKYKIEDLEIHDRKFVSMTCDAYLPAPTEAMNLSDGEWYLGTVYASNVVKDVEETETDAASVDEVKIEETETDAEIAAMEKEIERKKRLVEYKTTVTFPQRLKRFSEQLINLYAQIAEVENEMWDYQLYAEELVKEYEGEIAALEAEIFNRKMIEAQEYINVSEEAFNISVQAEIDAANNVKAIENLMQAALNTALTEVEPVSFAIERFNEGEVETAAAVVDTSVAEVPIVDEDAEIEKKRSEIAKYRAKIDAINAKIAELENMRDEEFAKMEDIEDEISDMLWSAKESVMHIYDDKPIKQKMVLIGQDGSHHKVNPRKDYRISVDISGRNGLFTVTFLEGATSKYEFVAQYNTIKTFKAAMAEFGKAIERGDEEFAFPADNANTNK